MEEYGVGDLLSEAMGFGARVVVVEDCVEAPAAFVLHLLLKRALAGGGAAAFLALAQPFAHYDRVLRKMGCNLSLNRKSERLHFFELQAFRGGAREGAIADSFARLYSEIQRVAEVHRTGENAGHFTVVIDDVSLLEVAAHGSVDDVLDFLHYCVTLTSDMNCSLVAALDAAARQDPAQVIAAGDWRSPLELPFLWLGDVHPSLLTSLLRTLSPSPRLLAAADCVDRRIRAAVPAVSDRLRRAQEAFVSTEVSGVADVEAFLEELKGVALEANRLRRGVLSELVAACWGYQAALFLEALSRFVLSMHGPEVLRRFDQCRASPAS